MSGGNKIKKPQDPEEEGTSQPKPEHEEPVKTGLDPGESSGNKKQGKSVSLNNSYEKSPLHKNFYDGTGKCKRRTNHKGDQSVRYHFVSFYIYSLGEYMSLLKFHILNNVILH